VKEMSPREILDAIRKGLEESARVAAEHKPERAAGPPQRGQPARSIDEMTAREILEAIDRGLDETSRRFAKDPGAHSIGISPNRELRSRRD
jgi:hypothetical protein